MRVTEPLCRRHKYVFSNASTTCRHFVAATVSEPETSGLLDATGVVTPEPVTIHTVNGRLRGVRPGFKTW